MATKKKALKKSKLRHAEYYDFQKIQDKLYAESMDGKMFTKPVSYTHLDVYKRQPGNRPLFLCLLKGGVR